MPDREKVIKGLECCIKQAENDIYCEQMACPYWEPVKDHARLLCWTKLNRYALELLKEQEEKIKQLRLVLSVLNGKEIVVNYGSTEP